MKSTTHLAFLAVLCAFLQSGSLVHSQISDRPKAGPELKLLEVWNGEWAYEGTLKETKLGPGGKFAGRDVSRWILDGLFLESRDKDKGVYGGKEMTYEGLTLHWYDAATKTYRTRSFDNDGVISEGSETVNGKTWTSSGSGVGSKGQKMMNRNTTTFAEDGRSYSAKSEISFDEGKTWTVYWELTAKKTTP